MIITIARQCGCGAVNVGRLLAAHYHIPLYTRQNLMEMSTKRGLAQRLDDFFEERPVDELLFSIASYGDERPALTERPLRLLAEMIGLENCIIVGRCGNHIFRNRQDLVSVFLGGNFDKRIEAIGREQQLSWAAAREQVEHTDDCRAAYHRYYTGLTWGNAADYDLCIDSIRLGAEPAAKLIEQYIESVGGLRQ